jgi:excisionase family DNA binding protein
MLGQEFTFVSVAEAADILGVSGARVRQLLLAEKLKGQKLGLKSWAIPMREIDAYAAQGPPRKGRPRKSPEKSEDS